MLLERKCPASTAQLKEGGEASKPRPSARWAGPSELTRQGWGGEEMRRLRWVALKGNEGEQRRGGNARVNTGTTEVLATGWERTQV